MWSSDPVSMSPARGVRPEDQSTRWGGTLGDSRPLDLRATMALVLVCIIVPTAFRPTFPSPRVAWLRGGDRLEGGRVGGTGRSGVLMGEVCAWLRVEAGWRGAEWDTAWPPGWTAGTGLCSRTGVVGGGGGGVDRNRPRMRTHQRVRTHTRIHAHRRTHRHAHTNAHSRPSQGMEEARKR